MSLIRGVFHIHTHYSGDSNLSPEKLVDFAINNDIKLLGIMDHNTLKGALETQKIISELKLDVKVIIGSEIATKQGEIAGLFLTREVSKGMNLFDTIQAIKKQNALVYLPHPFDSVRRERIKDKKLILNIIEQIDIVEIFNSRNMLKRDNQLALKLASEFKKYFLWGSDAHFLYELKNCIFEIPDFKMSPVDFLKSIQFARILKKNKSIRGFFQSILKKYLPFSIF